MPITTVRGLSLLSLPGLEVCVIPETDDFLRTDAIESGEHKRCFQALQNAHTLRKIRDRNSSPLSPHYRDTNVHLGSEWPKQSIL